MSVIIRGAKNAVRNPIRAGSVVLLLGVATAFALSLLLANQAVKNKIANLKTTGATILTILPAGSGNGFGFQGGGEPLTSAMYDQVKTLAHISDNGATLNLEQGRRGVRFETGAGGAQTFQAPESKIALESPIDAGTLGRRSFSNGASDNTDGSTAPTPIPDFKLPVQATGVSGNLNAEGENYALTAGDWFTTADGYQAVVGKDLATKNSLKVGSTFVGYDQTFTVVGIFDAGSTFANAGVLMPLKTAQTLSAQTGEVTSIIVKADSIDNIGTVEAAIKNALGSDKVDVTSSAQNTTDAINSLKSIQRISVAGVVIAIVAAAVIVFVVMVMIVRERKKEIAVLKAIGGSNIKITGQFVTEAVVLTLLSVVVGSLIALASSNSITKLLVTTNTKDSTTSSDSSALSLPGGGRVRRIIGGPRAQREETTTKDLLKDVKTSVGGVFIAEGLAVVVLIGVLGSAIPAFAISKIRPAEVMRGE